MKKKIKYLCITSPLLLINVQSYAADEWRFETQLTSYSVSKLIPIKSLADDTWAGEYQAADNIFTSSRGDIAIGKGEWLVGVSNRFDYFGRFSKDTGRYFYLDKNKIDQPDNQALDIYLNVEHAQSHGAFIQYDNQWNDITYAIRLNYWHSEKVLSGTIDGNVNTETEQKLSGQLNFDYNYDEDTIFDRLTPDYIDGAGYSMDVDIAWQVNETVDLSLKMKDIAHRIQWKQVYHTQAKLDRAPDKEISTPSLSGIENNEDYTQRFKQQTYFQLGYLFDTGRAFGGTDYINNKHHTYLGFERNLFKGAVTASIAYYPDTKSVKLGLGNEYIGVSLGVNKISFSDTNTLLLSMYLKY